MATVKINTPYNVNVNFELAGIDKRFLAWLIDFFVRIFVVYILWLIFKHYFEDTKLDGEDAYLSKEAIRIAAMLPAFFYFFLCEAFLNGQSIGKKIMRIRVASLEGYKPTATQYLTRWCFRLVDLGFVSLLFLGFGGLYDTWIGLAFLIPNLIAVFLILSSKKEQRIGDMASGTVVIRLESSTHLSDTIFENVRKDYVVVFNNVLKLSDRDVTIIKTALLNYEKSGNDTTLWLIAQKLQQVLEIKDIGDPYLVLETVIKDYNYLTAN